MDLCFLFLVNLQRIVRLEKWYFPYSLHEKKRVLNDIITLVLKKKETDCPVVEYKNVKIVFKRYASLYFIGGIPLGDANEIMAFELIHRYVEILDIYFENVCELDILFNFEKAYYILDELVVGGIIKSTSTQKVLEEMHESDFTEKESKRTN